jgi:hypothetical protein
VRFVGHFDFGKAHVAVDAEDAFPGVEAGQGGLILHQFA